DPHSFPTRRSSDLPLLFPGFEADDLARTLSSASRDALQNFVARGGVVILHGANNDVGRPVRFLNSVWGFGVAYASSYSFLTRSAAAQGTAFATDQDWLPFNNYTEGLLPSSLPEGALSLYQNAGQTS